MNQLWARRWILCLELELFELAPQNTVPENGSDEVLTTEELIKLANQAFENATAAQQSGDWSSYGQYLKQLDDYLTQLMPERSGRLKSADSTDGNK